MNYVEHLNNFAAASLDSNLGPNELAVYMRIFWKANNDFWPEFVEMSLADLQKATGIKSHHTVIKARKILKSLGFIDFEDLKGKKTKYHIVDFEYGKNCLGKNYLGKKCPSTSAKNAQVPRQNLPNTSAKNAYPAPSQASNISASAPPINNKHINNNKLYYREPAQNNDLAEVFSLYQENITTAMSPIDAEKLEDDVKTYGKAKVMYAILRAVEMRRKNLSYIEGILKNNKEGEIKSNDKKRNVNTNSDPERDEANRKWREQLRDAEANQDFPWERPDYKSTEG